MLPFIISFFLNFTGPGASSGIVYEDKQLYIVSDDSDFLYHYDMELKQMKAVPLREQASSKVKKADKMDLESISKKGDVLYMLGSASKPNRKDFITYNIKTGELIRKNYNELFEKMVKVSGVPTNEINIEGLIVLKDKALLFNRGNGPGNHNGIFTVYLRGGLLSDVQKYSPIKLPLINGVQSGFSDAVLVKNKIYFIGTGEATSNTVDDGTIKGSYIGILKLRNFKGLKTKEISSDKKIEGITWYAGSKAKPVFLLCEDADNGAVQSTIYKLQ